MEVSSFAVGIHFGSLVKLLKQLLLHSDLSRSFPLLSLFQGIAGIRGDCESLWQSNALFNWQHAVICVISLQPNKHFYFSLHRQDCHTAMWRDKGNSWSVTVNAKYRHSFFHSQELH